MTSELTQPTSVEIDEPSPELAVRLGFAAALMAAGLTVCFVVLTLLFPAEPWRGIDVYATSFQTIGVVQLVPVLLLAPVVVALMACIHHLAADTRHVASHLAATFAAIYAAIIATNYVLQLVVVRLNVAAGEFEDLSLLAMPNPRSIFTALEITGYGFFAFMALAAGAAFAADRPERGIRYTFLVTGATGVVGAVGGLADQRIVMLAGFGLSLLSFLAAVVLLGVYFRRLGRTASAPSNLTCSGAHEQRPGGSQ